MCGISGLWFQSEIKVEKLLNYGSIMSKALYKRGPDSDGIWFEKNSGLVLSHRRLAIKDLTLNGSQPIVSSNSKFIMVFNGEIYNYIEIKKELKDQNWRGTSDTEVLFYAIQKWGLKKAINKCHGMFSIAFWDRDKKTLIIARDRFGEKPLYWGRIKLKGLETSVFAFTSDLCALWGIPEIQKEINYSAFSDFLKYGYVCAPNSIHKGIFQLKPGHYLEIKNNNGFAPQELPKEKCWWDINKVSSNILRKQDNKNKVNLLEETLNIVLKEQKSADVPLASFLSGGIDSSLITALLQNQTSEKIKSFTISFPEEGYGESLYNEGPYAKKIANYLNTDHTEVPLTSKDIQNVIPEIPNIYSEPFADASQLATYLICKEIRSSGIKVAISGDGGDELFGGYNRHIYGALIQKRLGNVPNRIRNLIAQTINLYPSKKEGISEEKKRKLISAIKNGSSLNTIYDAILSNSSKIRDFHKYPDLEDSQFIKLHRINAPTNEEKIMLADTISYLPNDILVKLDRASMNEGLETRSPFLDERIAKIAWSLSLSNKININGKNEGKKVLREILFKLVPKEYFDRPKQGFSIPIASWLKGPLNEWANDMFNQHTIERQGFLSYQNVKNIWDDHSKGNYANTELIWSLLMWQSWIQKWESTK